MWIQNIWHHKLIHIHNVDQMHMRIKNNARPQVFFQFIQCIRQVLKLKSLIC